MKEDNSTDKVENNDASTTPTRKEVGDGGKDLSNGSGSVEFQPEM